MKLKDKVAIVTGGANGIGLGCAKAMAGHGAAIVIGDRNETDGLEAQRQLTDMGHQALFVPCDVTDESQMRQLVDQTMQRLGRLDCMVNNAGWHPPSQTIEQTDVEDFESLLRLNLTSTFMGCKFAVPFLKETHGSIINMASEVAMIGQAEAPSYVASKAGQVGLTKALALDLAAHGVRVNCICPAGVMTPLMQDWASTQYDAKAALEMVDSWHPLGRMATAEQIGEVCAFLASDEAAFVTGQAICPDGGAALGYRR